MKWKNMSHEYDDVYAKYDRFLNEHNDTYCIFGAGENGKTCLKYMLDMGNRVEAIIDNDPDKQGNELLGVPIISFQEFDSKLRDSYLIISVSLKNVDSVLELVDSHNYVRERDYSLFTDFVKRVFPLIQLYRNDRLMLNIVELALTERCTLRCKKCAHGCAYVEPDRKDLSLSIVKKSVDSLFHYVDYLNEFYLIGGEPLLYRELNETITYIGEKYRSKINRFIITTNGTIIPSEEILDAAAKYATTFFISNYSATLPQLKQKYQKLCNVLEERGVSFSLSGIERQWYDYGFDYVDHGYDKKLLESIYTGCFTECREIRGSKLYYCIQARSVSENMHFRVSKDDYLEISELNPQTAKRILFEFSSGYCLKGYADMCNYCNGSDSRNHLIPVAEQL